MQSYSWGDGGAQLQQDSYSSMSGSNSFSPAESVSQIEEFDESIISVSSTFHPNAQLSRLDPDLILVSLDSVLFYVHSGVVYLTQHDNSQRPNAPPPTPPRDSYSNEEYGQKPSVISVPESSEVLNIILHTAYNISCAQYFPAFDKLSIAVNSLSTYGLDAQNIRSTTPLYDVLLSKAPTSPLELYALAGHHDLYDLAVATSPHLLSLSLSTITDEVCETMGPVYLKRLFFLHLGRCDALRRVLRLPPDLHPSTTTCGIEEQKKLATAWAMASSYLVWDPRPDLSAGTIQHTFNGLGDNLSCAMCRHSLANRIKTLINQWMGVKRTI